MKDYADSFINSYKKMARMGIVYPSLDTAFDDESDVVKSAVIAKIEANGYSVQRGENDGYITLMLTQQGIDPSELPSIGDRLRGF